MNGALAAGADLRFREPVRGWAPTPEGGVRVETERGAYAADRLVICAGAWARTLVPSLDNLAVPDALFNWSSWPLVSDFARWISLGPTFNLLPLISVALMIVSMISCVLRDVRPCPYLTASRPSRGRFRCGEEQGCALVS